MGALQEPFDDLLVECNAEGLTHRIFPAVCNAG